jgi:hypothetical protein
MHRLVRIPKLSSLYGSVSVCQQWRIEGGGCLLGWVYITVIEYLREWS